MEDFKQEPFLFAAVGDAFVVVDAGVVFAVVVAVVVVAVVAVVAVGGGAGAAITAICCCHWPRLQG